MPQPSATPTTPAARPTTLRALRASGWQSRSVKEELRDNLIAALKRGGSAEDLFPGIVGYDDTVIPELINAILACHDILFLGEKGQAKSRLMRSLVRFLDDAIPYLDIRATTPSDSAPSAHSANSAVVPSPVHEDPYHPITAAGKRYLAEMGDDARISWWPRQDRYAERLAPGTKFADIIGEIDPAKLLSGASMSAEESLHFGLIPRMHRGIFAMNELPDLDDLVQVGLFDILEERDVQIRGHPIKFDIDVLVLFSANPSTYNRSGKVIPQLKDRIGATIQTHYPRSRDLGIEIMEQEASVDTGGEFPVIVPHFMKEVVEQMAIVARKSKYIDQASGVSARFSIANYRTMIASARQRSIRLGEKPAVPRISDLAHFQASAIGKLELDLMGSHQMSEKQTLDAILAEAVKVVFEEYIDKLGLSEIGEVFSKGVKIEVGDMLPSSHYEKLIKRVPKVWDKAFEVNASSDPAVRASCAEFILAGLWATDTISRAERHGRLHYEL
ncbi:MAG TPA: magnesium chelatase [Phycisphaerales bacterium]|nr:magnesium chelatase [Phycisphaerales bacterium]